MTYLGDEIFISTDNFAKHYRLPVSENNDAFLINSARSSVSSVQKTDQKLIQTWNLSQPKCFTSPAIYWSSQDSICCIVDHKKIFVWSLCSDSLKSSRKIKFQDPIFAILPVGNETPFVVFNNGTTIPMDDIDNASSYAPPYHISNNEILIWTDVLVIEESVLIVQLTNIKTKKIHNLRSFTINKGSFEVSSVSCISLAHKSLILKSCCLNNSKKYAKFLTLWENGDVCSHVLNEEKVEILFKIPHISNATLVGIDIVGVSHLAVVKYNNKESNIEIWDLKYCIVKESKDLTRRLSKNLQVRAIKSSIFVSATDGLLMLPVNLEPSTLSAAIGKLEMSHSTENTFIWSSDPKDEDMILDLENASSKSSNSHLEKSFDNVLTELTQGNFSKCSQFLEESSNISEEQLIKILKIFLSFDKGKTKHSNQKTSSDYLLNSIFYIPFSDIFLRQQLRKLSFNETLVVLEKLLAIFSRNLFCAKDNKEPNDLQVVTWIQLIMQVHFEELLLSPDKNIQLLLKKLQNSLQEKMDVYCELKEIKYLITLIEKKKNILPEISSHTKYCIETLHL